MPLEKILSIVGHLPRVAEAETPEWPEFREYAQLKYPDELDEDLIPQGTIDTLTRLVLTNAIYFIAAWQYPFNEETTVDGTFNLLDSAKITVPMMNQTESFGYAEGDNYRVVELPYDGQELSMVILLPKAGQRLPLVGHKGGGDFL